MQDYIWILPIAVALWLLYMGQREKRRNAAVVHHRKKHSDKERKIMKELAEKFIGKECLVYTIASNSESVNGVITEVTDNGILIDYKGNLTAVNLEYVTRIREWPRTAKGKKRSFM